MQTKHSNVQATPSFTDNEVTRQIADFFGGEKPHKTGYVGFKGGKLYTLEAAGKAALVHARHRYERGVCVLREVVGWTPLLN